MSTWSASQVDQTVFKGTVLCLSYKMGMLLPAVYTPEDCLRRALGNRHKGFGKV